MAVGASDIVDGAGGGPPGRIGWAVRAGLVAILPTQMMVGPFGLLSGVISAESGLDLVQTLALSVLVFAGAAQLATLELLSDAAPILVIVLTGLAINLRFVMYAAAMKPWIRGVSGPTRLALGYFNVDNAFGVSMIWFRAESGASAAERAAFYLAGAVFSWVVWQAATVTGFALGAALPASLSLDFAAPIAFLGLALPLLVDRPAWIAAGVAMAVSALAWELPYNLNIVLAGAAGIAAGYVAERWRAPGAGDV